MHTLRTAGRRAIAPLITMASLALALAACHDTPTAVAVDSGAAIEMNVPNASNASSRGATTATNAASARLEALRDALVRVQPSLVPDARAATVATGLQQAIAALEKDDSKSADKAFTTLEQALERYSRNDAAQWPDVEVIRLAMRAASRR